MPENNIATIEKEVHNIKGQIEEAKRSEAIFEGRIQESVRRLKEEYGLENTDVAKKELGKLKVELGKLEEKAKDQFDNLKETYQW